MMIRKNYHRTGFSLLELLLALVIFISLMLTFLSILQTYAEREKGRATARYITTVADAMNQILSNIDNFEALYGATQSTLGGYQLTADSTAGATDNIAKDFTIGAVKIQGSRLLNDQFRATSPLQTPVRILLRIADDVADPTDTPGLEVIIVTAAPKPEPIVRAAASELKEHGGVIRTYSGKANAVITHLFNSWNVKPSSGLQATPWYRNELRGNLNTKNNGSYLVYYNYVNAKDVMGDYLYRTPDSTTERNTMYGALNLGGNNIIGIDDINIGNNGSQSNITGTTTGCDGNVLCVNGTAFLNGSGTIRRNITVNGSALVADSANAKSIRVENGLTSTQRETYGAQGHLVVDGTGSTQDRVDITNDATFTDGATVSAADLGDIESINLSMPDGGAMTARNILNTNRISSTQINSQALNVTHQLKAGIVENGDVSVSGGRLGAINIHDSKDLIYGSASDPKILNAPIVKLGTLNVENFGNCTNGCGQ